MIMVARYLTLPTGFALVAFVLTSAVSIGANPVQAENTSKAPEPDIRTGRSLGLEIKQQKWSTAQVSSESRRNQVVEKTAVASPEGSTIEKATSLPFPLVPQDAVSSLSGVQQMAGRSFPSAIEIRGNARGLLLHARKETKYDLLSPVSLWLESGPLLVAVRAPSDLALIATKFGDVCVTAGADALLERGEGTLRITNLSTAHGTVNLVMHDRQWKNSPWAHLEKVRELNKKASKGKKRSDDFESGCLALAPGYELVVGDHSLEISEVKPADSVGRRDIKIIGDSGRFAISELCIDHLIQTHDLVRNLKEHGERANNILTEINKVGVQFKTKQGEDGFEKVVPVVKAPEPVKRPDPKSKTPPKAPLAVTPKKTSVEGKSPPYSKGGAAVTGSGGTSGSGGADSGAAPVVPKSGSTGSVPNNTRGVTPAVHDNKSSVAASETRGLSSETK